MIIKLTVTGLNPNTQAGAWVQQIARAIQALRQRPLKINTTSRDNLSNVDITRMLPNRN